MSGSSTSLPGTETGLAKVTPMAPRCFVSSMTAAVCRRALEGMQPTLRQTPPKEG